MSDALPVTNAIRKALKIASFSDVHVGHRTTPTMKCLDTLSKAFPDTAETAELDLIVIAGDFFDKMLTLPANCVTNIDLWIANFLKMCAKRNIKLRVLEGTPSHDRKQNERFVLINRLLGDIADLKYVADLEIEHIHDFGIDVLYIPDELTSCCKKTEQMVTELLVSKGLTKIDYTVMHGMMDYRLPEHLKSKGHSSKFYQRITRKYVFCGHVHLMNQFGNILEAGSSERLTMGEEGDKGHWRVTEQAGGDQVVFRKHHNTTIYKTVDVRGLELDGILDKLDAIGIAQYPVGSFVRLFLHKGSPGISEVGLLKDRYRTVTFTTPKVEKVEVVKVEPTETLAELNVVEINKNNIYDELSIVLNDLGHTLTPIENETMRRLLDVATA